MVQLPKGSEVEWSTKAKWRNAHHVNIAAIQDRADEVEEHLKELYGDKYSKEYMKEITVVARSVRLFGRQYYQELHTAKKNYTNGRRVTCGQPDNPEITVFVFGKCTIEGALAEDRCTIPSLLQDKLNRYYPEKSIIVENYGFAGTRRCYLEWMENCSFGRNDIVVVVDDIPFPMDGIKTEERLQQQLNGKEWFLDGPEHCNEKANQVFAEIIFEKIAETSFITEEVPENIPIVLKQQGDKETCPEAIREYLDKIRKIVITKNGGSYFDGIIGAIVMNCNPFTRGHRFLIEEAAKKVDYLLIFVVEEDSSYFSFQERFQWVVAGTRDLEKVVVVGAGNFVLSSLTFSEYFSKDDKQECRVDATWDIGIFATYIAPALGITIRFAGTEPIDKVTRQYNDAMRKILPSYGICFCEIERLCSNAGEPVSASRVRKLLADKEWEELKTLIPETTVLE